MTFEQAKDQIAKKQGHADWKILEYRMGRDDVDKLYTEAANLYAEEKAREAWETAGARTARQCACTDACGARWRALANRTRAQACGMRDGLSRKARR